MSSSPREDNRVPGLVAKSDADNTPVIVEADPITKRLKVQSSLAMTASDITPTYNNLSLGGIPLRTDAAGNLAVAAEVITDQGTGRANWTGTSISYSPGTATFTNGSATVTGTGFSTTDLHYLDFVKISAHNETAWAQVSYVNSDTSLTLIATYTGATATGAYDIARAATVTGSGATISVAAGQLTMASGTTNAAASVVYKTSAFPPLQNITGVNQVSISQRINNQDIYVGLEQQTTSSRYFARFHFSGTTNTQVITETGYNPTTTPSASETETNTVTLPSSATTASMNTYKVDYQYDQVVFSINGVIVATHIARLPQIWLQVMNNQVRVVNGTGASTTSVVSNFMYSKAYSRIDVSNQVTPSTMISDGTNSANILKSDGTTAGQNAQIVAPAVQTITFTTSSSGVQTILANTDVSHYTWIEVVYTSVGSGLALTGQYSTVSGGTYINSNSFGSIPANAAVSALGVAVNTPYAGPIRGNFFQIAVSALASGTFTGTVTLRAVAPPLPAIAATQNGTWTVGSNSATGSAVPANGYYVAIQQTGGTLTGISAASNTGDAGGNSSAAVAPVVYNGATWDRQRSATGASNTTGTGLMGVNAMVYDGTNYQVNYGVVGASNLASAARTATTNGGDQTNINWTKAAAILNITAASGSGGLQIQWQGKDPISGTYYNINTAPTAIIATGIYVYELYTGSAGAISGDIKQRVDGLIPKTFRIRVVHGDASSYTYSVALSVSN